MSLIPLKPSDVDRFWTKVDKGADFDCWNWLASCQKLGYGQFPIRPPQRKLITPVAHRVAFQLHYGYLPEAGKQVDHICGNRKCVNPAHLREVTVKQNIENIQGARRDSSTGIRGVRRVGSRWYAYVTHHGQRFNLGSYPDAASAEAAAIAKRNELFTHNERDRKSA